MNFDFEEEPIYPRLRYQFSTGTGQRDDPLDYMISLNARIVCEYCPEDSDTCTEVNLGNIDATLIRVGQAINQGFSLFEIFDERQELLDLSAALYAPGYDEFVEPIRKLFPYTMACNDLLHITDFYLEPIVRGQRAGISALHRFVTDWESGCAFVAIKPEPMQCLSLFQDLSDCPELQLDKFPQDEETAIAKLGNHFGGLGFKKIDPIPYMLYSPEKMQAPVDEMALERTLTLSEEELAKLPSA